MNPIDIKKYKNNALNALIIIVTLVVAYNIYNNQTKNMQLLKDKEDIELKKNEVLGKISQAEKVVSSYKSYLNRKDLSLLINTIGNLAKETNVTIIAIKPGMEEKHPIYTRYPFDLSVGALDYHAVGKFISKLESHPDIYFVDKFAMRNRNNSDADSKYVLVADMTISTIMLSN